MKSNLVFLLFFAVLATIHFTSLTFLPEKFFSKDLILGYTALFAISITGNTLIQWGRKKNTSTGLNMLMVFITLQMLASLSFGAYLAMKKVPNAKYIALQFVLMFFTVLIFQTIYLVRMLKKS